MKEKTRLFSLLLFLFSVINILYAQEKDLQILSTYSPFELHRFTLDNGLRVWYQPRSDSGAILLALIVQAGSRNENSGNNGISHFVEHMIFNGTERWDEKEINDIINKIGGRYNGYTHKDKTAFFVEASSEHFNTAIDWLSEIVFHSTFPEDKIEKERQIIYQEKGGKDLLIYKIFDTIGFKRLHELIVNFVYPNSSLAFNIIGEDKSIETFNRDILLEYYRKFYISNNMILIVIGNINKKKVYREVNKYFGNISTGESPQVPQPPSMPEDGPFEYKDKNHSIFTDNSDIYMGFRSAGFNNSDYWKLEVLKEYIQIISNDELRVKRGLVYHIYIDNIALSNAAYFNIYTESKLSNEEIILDFINDTLKNACEGQIDEDYLIHAKSALSGRLTLSLEYNYYRADWLSNWALVLDRHEPLPDYKAEIDNVTSEELIRVVKKYYTPESTFTVIRTPFQYRKLFMVILFPAIIAIMIIALMTSRIYDNYLKSQVLSIKKTFEHQENKNKNNDKCILMRTELNASLLKILSKK